MIQLNSIIKHSLCPADHAFGLAGYRKHLWIVAKSLLKYTLIYAIALNLI